MPSSTLERQLAAIVGSADLLNDPDICAPYGHDITGRFGGPPALVVRPADGRVVRRLAGLLKDNAGYDLTQLVIGSEGTLAVVTAARLRLVPAPAHVVTALLGVGSTADAVDVMRMLRDRVASLNAVEILY